MQNNNTYIYYTHHYIIDYNVNKPVRGLDRWGLLLLLPRTYFYSNSRYTYIVIIIRYTYKLTPLGTVLDSIGKLCIAYNAILLYDRRTTVYKPLDTYCCSIFCRRRRHHRNSLEHNSVFSISVYQVGKWIMNMKKVI